MGAGVDSVTETGEYRLLLKCDSLSSPCSCSEVYSAATRMEAKIRAREDGWYIPVTTKRIFCPACATKRRETRYER